MRRLNTRACSIASLVVGPAQYPLGWVVVGWLYRHGLSQTHTWKEQVFILVYVVGAVASIWFALKAASRHAEDKRRWAFLAFVLSLANLIPTYIVVGGW